jgi:serine-type D-Ala-D-Ala carboxypeptidase/endopeptidase (penicillin-binding protein 4)
MRALIVALGAIATVALSGAPAAAKAHQAHHALNAAPAAKSYRTPNLAPAAAKSPLSAQRALRAALRRGLKQAGAGAGVYVVDLTTGRALFAARATVPRMPASVEKLYTTSTALLRFGPTATFTTELLGRGSSNPARGFTGTLYLRGGGDPTFGSAAFDAATYGTGATVQQLVADTVASAGITAVHGAIEGDVSYFDADRGTPATGNAFSPELEGSLSGLAFNRGVLAGGTRAIPHPAVYAARQLALALRAAGVKVPKRTAIGAAAAPTGARVLGVVASPPLATLISLTNAPSDNFFAEMLLKDLGAAFGGAGTTAAGASVVRAELASVFAVHPTLVDGSGLSRSDRTTPRQVVKLLTAMASNSAFVSSLAVAGRSGTLQSEMVHTPAQGRCRGKTGTLHDASNLVGYCQARDGHTLAFAFLINAIDPSYAHPIQNAMAIALASYNG